MPCSEQPHVEGRRVKGEDSAQAYDMAWYRECNNESPTHTAGWNAGGIAAGSMGCATPSGSEKGEEHWRETIATPTTGERGTGTSATTASKTATPRTTITPAKGQA